MIDSILAVLLSYIVLASAALRNITIDDETGDASNGQPPTYVGRWLQGAACDGCGLKPDPGQAFGGTWHDARVGSTDTTGPAFTLQFSGQCI